MNNSRDILNVLIKSRELISDSYSWIKRTAAQDKQGNKVDPSSLDACRFCEIGAISAAGHILGVDAKVLRSTEDALRTTLERTYNVLRYSIRLLTGMTILKEPILKF